MVCPKCKSRLGVYATLPVQGSGSDQFVLRDRRCECGYGTETVELESRTLTELLIVRR